MTKNVDERLLARWTESRAREERTRTRLAQSSLPAERFEGWALDLITEALSPAGRDDGGEPPVASAESGLEVCR